MNARERMRTAMAKGIPDRVPVMCQLSLGHYFLNSGLPVLDVWHDSGAFAEALVILQKRYGFDGILVNLPGRDPSWRRYMSAVEDGSNGEAIIRWENGSFTVAPHNDNPHVYTSRQTRYFPEFDELDPDQLFYVDPHDISGLSYPATWGFSGHTAKAGEDFFPPWQMDTFRKVREFTGGQISVHTEFFSPLSQMLELLDYSNGLIALIDDPGKVHAILDRLSEGAITLAKLQARAGADALLISSAFAGAGLISREHYVEFELPYITRIVASLRNDFPNLPVYIHTCGAIGDRLDLMEQTGVDGIDTFDPPPLGTVELKDAVTRLGKRVFIKGNVDPVNTVLNGSPDDVRTACRERIETAAPGGGYILSTACSISPYAPAGNVVKMREAAEEFGKY